MQHIAIVSLGALAAISVTTASLAQPPGITMEMINTTLPEEGAPLAIAGPYSVVSETAFGSAGHMLFRPADLAPFPADDTLPVVIWGNGGCAIDSSRYGGFLSTIASHGFLVLGTAASGGRGGQATADDLLAALAWAETENDRAASPLNGRIDLDQVAVMGQSCGGFLSVSLGADPRVDTIGVFNSGVQPAAEGAPAGPFPTAAALDDLHGPVLLINGHERDFMLEASAANFDMIEHLPVFYGARHNAGHTATVFHPGGGEFANVASNWVLWLFKNDSQAGEMFAGNDCALCTNPNWDTQSKGWD